MFFVTPLVGVWIEIRCFLFAKNHIHVTPLVGVWIEIDWVLGKIADKVVTPLVGVWIEIGQSKGILLVALRHSPCGSVD